MRLKKEFLPSQNSNNISPMSGTKIYADDDTLIGELRVEKGVSLPLNRMPKHPCGCSYSSYQGSTVRVDAIGRAVLKDILHLKKAAAQPSSCKVSLTPEKTSKRKIREASLRRRWKRI